MSKLSKELENLHFFQKVYIFLIAALSFVIFAIFLTLNMALLGGILAFFVFAVFYMLVRYIASCFAFLNEVLERLSMH